METAVRSGNFFLAVAPFLALIAVLVLLRDFDRIYRFFVDRRSRQKYCYHTGETPARLLTAIERMRDGRPDVLKPFGIGRKPVLLAVAEEFQKREERRLQQTEEKFETEADKVDDAMRHELKVRRAMAFAVENAKRQNYRSVAHRRLFHERSPRYRHRFRTTDKYQNGVPTATTVMHSVPTDKFPHHKMTPKEPAVERKKEAIYSEF